MNLKHSLFHNQVIMGVLDLYKKTARLAMTPLEKVSLRRCLYIDIMAKGILNHLLSLNIQL